MSRTDLTKISNVEAYTKSLFNPVVLHVTTCDGCPLRMSCFARRSLYNGDYNLAACSRCWCVYFEMHPHCGLVHPDKELHICARLRHGIYERPDAWRGIPAERVRVAIDAADHRFAKMLKETEDELRGLIGCKEFAQKQRKSEWSSYMHWNPEHPLNLSENLREYLSTDHCNEYRDDSIRVSSDDCLTVYRTLAAWGVDER